MKDKKRRRKSNQGRLAFGTLAAAIIVAPTAGGSANIWMLPVLSVLVGCAYVFTLFATRRSKRRLHVFGLPVVLLGLGLLTLLQIVPLPEVLLAFFSPKAHELRSFVSSNLGFAPLSYEPGITAREATELFVCALVVIVAHERTRARRTSFRIIVAILAGVVACILVGAIHRLGHFEKMLGLVSSSRPAYQLLTTFVNPNHAAGFTAWGAIIALGLALEEPRRHIRAGFGLLALFCAATSVLCASRGGLAMLAIGLIGFIAIYLKRRIKTEASISGVWLGLIVVVPLVIGYWTKDKIIREFGSSLETLIGAEEKLSAIDGAQHMIYDHPWFGIGRGSYVSLFSHYKTTPYQYTYTHPENIAVQVLADWGVMVGVLVLFGLSFMLIQRSRKTIVISELAAIIGLSALCLQNFVDFSLELLGAALPAAALLGAVAYTKVQAFRVDLSRLWVFLPTLFLPLGLLSFSCYLAFEQGNLEDDLNKLTETPAAALAERHPANAVAALRMSFHAETETPPQIRDALRWANRALYLAPSYAEAHLVAGRLLIKSGHRKQGFEEMRTAWKLQYHRSLGPYFAQISYFARNTSELLDAVPRNDEARDSLDAKEIARLSTWLHRAKRPNLARELLRNIRTLENIKDPEALNWVAWAAFYTGMTSLALDAIHLRRKLTGNSLDGLDLELRICGRMSDQIKALECVERGLIAGDKKYQERKLPKAISLSLSVGDYERAKKYIESFELRMAPSSNNQLNALSFRVQLALAQKRDAEALHLLDRAINIAPSNLTARMQRARLFARTNRVHNAKNDLDFILRLSPEHRPAQTLLNRLKKKL